MTSFLLDKRFVNRVKARYENFDIQAGILQNGPHFTPARKPRGRKLRLTEIDGMQARRKSRIPRGTIEEVSQDLRRKTGINIFLDPLRKSTPEMKRFRKALLKMFGARKTVDLRKTAEKCLVDVIRAPIRKRQYGPNSILSARTKGFNRLMFDTGQVYQAIRARIRPKSKGGD